MSCAWLPRISIACSAWPANRWSSPAGCVHSAIRFNVFGASTIELYVVSATLHLGNWRKAAHRALRTLDHASIYLAVAAAYTPLGVAVLEGWVRVAVLVLVWNFALAGVAVTLLLTAITVVVNVLADLLMAPLGQRTA